jgi:16S rRNA (cytosine1402-N4)-methyltransferase
MEQPDAASRHRSVLLEESLGFFDFVTSEIIVDSTLGMGGHSEEMLERSESLRLIGLDQDAAALRLASERLARFGDRFTPIHTNFADIRSALGEAGIEAVDGVLADLGLSSFQIDSPERGFSFRFDTPLDMRMDPDAGYQTAAELLEELEEVEIANVIYQFGEERASRKIARRIVKRREQGRPVKTTTELADLVASVLGRKHGERIHPATRTFQALRIAVNRETEILEGFIDDAADVLRPGGVIAIIAFHSLEDRIVKNEFRRLSGKCSCPPRMPVCQCRAVKKLEILTKKPIEPTPAEAEANPRARSAKLRAARRLAEQEAR